MIHNFSRRQFMFRCLGVPVALGAAAKSPQVSNSSDFPESKFRLGQEVKFKIDDFDGEVLIEIGTIIGMIYEKSVRKRLEWVYLVKWSHCHNATHNFSWVPDQNEPDYLHEDDLVAMQDVLKSRRTTAS